jgi:hypothetical protein
MAKTLKTGVVYWLPIPHLKGRGVRDRLSACYLRGNNNLELCLESRFILKIFGDFLVLTSWTLPKLFWLCCNPPVRSQCGLLSDQELSSLDLFLEVRKELVVRRGRECFRTSTWRSANCYLLIAALCIVLKEQDSFRKLASKFWDSASVFREIQYPDAIPGSLQAKFRLHHGRQTPTPCCMTSVSWNLWTRGTAVSIPWIISWSLDHVHRSIFHPWKTVKKPHGILPKTVQNGSWSKRSVALLNRVDTLGSPFCWEFSDV